jgi:hypothetical protein
MALVSEPLTRGRFADIRREKECGAFQQSDNQAASSGNDTNIALISSVYKRQRLSANNYERACGWGTRIRT